MLGQYLCSTLESTFGYLLPAYQTYKTIETYKNGEANQESLKNCCIYWGIIGIWTICERVMDRVFFWVPLYDEFKVVFVIWLWYDQCGGAKYLYNNWLLPWLQKHQSAIDQQLEDIKSKVFSLVMDQSSQFVSYLRAVFFRVLFLINQIHQQTLQEESQQKENQQDDQFTRQQQSRRIASKQYDEYRYNKMDIEDIDFNSTSTSSSSSNNSIQQQQQQKPVKKSTPLPLSSYHPELTSVNKNGKTQQNKRKGNQSGKLTGKKSSARADLLFSD
eukprot:TRINITY_DN7970_c0_g2_i1.p1 TRINITY_DN7970_c0_g2~~TRINITY_DN7970_c0_g2_i1.p1  ORF type:complete len:273 (+),score=13.54 TRINITY_DN7970_c0_g2_i1:139-957(+)